MASTTLSFAGQSNKWNTAQDAAAVVAAIAQHKDLRVLDLENNTLGPEAAKVIGDALASHPEFERAHFKDLFTGRLKTEIPLALKELFSGIIRAGAKLLELDLSDNALGPVGVEGMVDFMCSPSCYSLQELRLNNNGLGITGGTMLARALEKLLDNSQRDGHPWKLKVFVAGRNRLEKVGAKVYAPIFERLGSLEELAMPQNGIFHEGIAALAAALSHNPHLRILNLNDNTFTVKGARAMAKHLPSMQELQVINFGDCLLKSSGATALAKALMTEHFKLEELYLDGNELTVEGGLSVVEAIQNKPMLKVLMLDDNMFGEEGRETIEALLTDVGKLYALQSLENNIEPDSDDDDEDSQAQDSSSSDDSDSDDSDDSQADTDDTSDAAADNDDDDDGVLIVAHIDAPEPQIIEELDCTITVGPFTSIPSKAAEYALDPTAERLLGLPVAERTAAAFTAATTADGSSTADQQIERLVQLLSDTAVLANTTDQELSAAAAHSMCAVAEAVMTVAAQHQLVSFTTNTILVHLGLVKCEDKTFTRTQQQRRLLAKCLTALVQQQFFPRDAVSTLLYFLSRPSQSLDAHPQEKKLLLEALQSC
uniref:Ran GTPase-activating protein 1-like n=1 Tax=Hirondellea gigas TaxID=1518452 RepID=A0A2P2HYP1_9CRUS